MRSRKKTLVGRFQDGSSHGSLFFLVNTYGKIKKHQKGERLQKNIVPFIRYNGRILK